jgi:hypothetical protein
MHTNHWTIAVPIGTPPPGIKPHEHTAEKRNPDPDETEM